MSNFPDIFSGYSESLAALHNLSASCRQLFMSACSVNHPEFPCKNAESWPGDGAAIECSYTKRSTGERSVLTPSCHHCHFVKRKFTLVDRRMRARAVCEALQSLLSAFFQVPMHDLRSAQRGRSHTARIRQFGMYIAHTMFGLSMSEVAYAFCRERTTVKHACHLIEDMRENEGFDRGVCSFEYLIRTIYPDGRVNGDE